MRLYRICPLHFLENYSGLGGSYKDGGRWNLPGVPVMYFALSPSVALLEMANYLPSPRLVPASYRLGIYELDTELVDEIKVG
ncbi:MAG: RES domain-containing protein, partial [Phenylobacterium sp.]